MTPPATEVGRRLGERRCGDCGGALSPSPRVRCQNVRCLAAHAAAVESSRRARRAALAREALERAGLDVAPGGWSVVPLNRASQVPVPAFQREAFLDRLRVLAEEARARLGDEVVARASGSAGASAAVDGPVAGGGPEGGPAGVLDPGTAALLGQACAACRGRCCRKGRTRHAFLEVSDLVGVATAMEAAGPGPDPDGLVSLYASFIGDTHSEGSCVYHGPEGCRLPRELRSRICNDYFCSPLVPIRDRGSRSGASPATHVFVAVSDEVGLEPEVGALRVVGPPPRPPTEG